MAKGYKLDIYFYLMLLVGVLLVLVACVRCGPIGDTKVIQNNCDYPSRWRIRISPDKQSELKGTPYSLFYWGNDLCEPVKTYEGDNGTEIHYFEFNTITLTCGIRPSAYENDTYLITIILPKRSDGIEIGGDHLVTLKCTIPVAHLSLGKSGYGPMPVIGTAASNETFLSLDYWPAVYIQLLRDGVAVTEGSLFFLGETLTMRVEVTAHIDIYTRVRVYELWATPYNYPTARPMVRLVSEGCSLETQAEGSVVPLFENFTRFDFDRFGHSVIKSDFRVFRFAGLESVYFWLNVITCTYADEVNCRLCDDPVSSRQRRSSQWIPAGSYMTLDGPDEESDPESSSLYRIRREVEDDQIIVESLPPGSVTAGFKLDVYAPDLDSSHEDLSVNGFASSIEITEVHVRTYSSYLTSSLVVCLVVIAIGTAGLVIYICKIYRGKVSSVTQPSQSEDTEMICESTKPDHSLTNQSKC